ncbi:MAG: type II toxin-antitoxin system HicA family toxin [Actinomycetia bacterium]|nr:type II toxin-antitoxin system HicA family toxin [Actinomycetes bacterium]
MTRRGWVLIRQAKGSHEIWANGGQRVVVPRHGQVSPGVLRAIARVLGDTPQEWK